MKKIVSFLGFCLILATVLAQAVLPTSAASSDISYFYDQLNAEEKNVYSAIKSALYGKTDIPAEISITLKTPLASTPQDTRPSEQQASQIVSALMQELMPHLQAALDALLADCPSIFFLDLTSESASDPSCGFSISAREEKTADDQYVMKTTAVKMKVVVKAAYQGNLSGHINQLKNAVAAVAVNGNTRYEKLQAIHTFVCQSTSYDRSFLDEKAHDAISVFAPAHKSVCEGYAKAVKLLCDRADIPCVLVTGFGVTSSSSTERHMWNLVQMEDGKWYGLDATWDDQDSGICTDFFLSGSSTLPSEGFYQRKFSESHVPHGDLSGTQSKVFSYPSLSKNAYSPYIGIAVKTKPQKLAYTTLDTAIDLTGLVLTLETASGTGPDVTSGFRAEAFDFSIVGTREVTVVYQGYTARFEVTVTQGQPQQGGGNTDGGAGNGNGSDQNNGGADSDNTNDGGDRTDNGNGEDDSPDGAGNGNDNTGEGDTEQKDPAPGETDDDENRHPSNGDGDEEDDPSGEADQGTADPDNGTDGSAPKEPEEEFPLTLWVGIGVAGVGMIAALVALLVKKK